VLKTELIAGQLIAGLESMPTQVVAAIETKMQSITINLQRTVITEKLHGQVLKQRSGKLARSIQQESHTEGETVIGTVFSAGDVKYARIHEYGGKTPPHDIVPDKGGALAFMMGGKMVFARVVHHPGSVMPERSFLRSSLAEQAEEITTGLKEAALRAAQKALLQ
jgi:phage gpG-like protein